MPSFIPGRQIEGSATSAKTAPGYGPTSLEYIISVMGEEKCESILVKLRFTGYGWLEESAECDWEAIIKCFDSLKRKIDNNLRGNTTKEQTTVEDDLYRDFMDDHFASTLRQLQQRI